VGLTEDFVGFRIIGSIDDTVTISIRKGKPHIPQVMGDQKTSEVLKTYQVLAPNEQQPQLVLLLKKSFLRRNA